MISVENPRISQTCNQHSSASIDIERRMKIRTSASPSLANVATLILSLHEQRAQTSNY
jgi:hypothetical protein